MKQIIYGCGHKEDYKGESDYITPKYLLCCKCAEEKIFKPERERREKASLSPS